MMKQYSMVQQHRERISSVISCCTSYVYSATGRLQMHIYRLLVNIS